MGYSAAPELLGIFCCCVPMCRIFIHGYFESLGGPLSPCGGLLLWSWPFIQIHSETLWTISCNKIQAERHLNMHRMVHLNKTFPWQKIFSKFQCPIILPIANLASTENFDPKAHPVQGKPWGQIDLPHWKPKVL